VTAGSRSGSSGNLRIVPLSARDSKVVVLVLDVFRFTKVVWQLPTDGRWILLRGVRESLRSVGHMYEMSGLRQSRDAQIMPVFASRDAHNIAAIPEAG
jgi:hypothetical protein